MVDTSGLGRHAICEFWGASHLNSVERGERALRDAGITGIAVIAESRADAAVRAITRRG